MTAVEKIESSGLKEFIDNQLVSVGISYRKLAEKLEEKGVKFSHTTLAAYHKIELGGTRPSETGLADPMTAKEIADIPKAAEGMLAEIFVNQCALTLKAQRRYMENGGKFPNAEFRALAMVHSMLGYKKEAEIKASKGAKSNYYNGELSENGV